MRQMTQFCKDIGLIVSSYGTLNLGIDNAEFIGVIIKREHQHQHQKKNLSPKIGESLKQRNNLQLQINVSLDRLRERLTSSHFIQKNKPSPRFM